MITSHREFRSPFHQMDWPLEDGLFIMCVLFKTTSEACETIQEHLLIQDCVITHNDTGTIVEAVEKSLLKKDLNSSLLSCSENGE